MKRCFLYFLFLFFALVTACKQRQNVPRNKLVEELHLKRGAVISCSITGNQFGSATFETSCGDELKEEFNLGIELLHSFEYDEAEKAFAGIIEKEPGCAIAYWGVAMSNFHPLWTPPTEAELKKGAKALEIAQSLNTTKREGAYINAIAAFYKDWGKLDHRTRCLRFEKEMENIYTDFPDDKEAAIFYCLALDAAADPKDKSFSRQKKAGGILQALYTDQPNHPGITHYLIHTYDYPELALLGLDAARKYASIAPSSAHALHMPSHIFTRLGLWDECIQSNQVSVASAKCYAEQAGIKGHWDEELHGLDYLAYAYLQKGENDSAKQVCEYLKTINEVYPVNFKVAYAFAAIPCRYVLENKQWYEASKLQVSPKNFPWEKFPWQEAIFHFSRLLGMVQTKNLDSAKMELRELNNLRQSLLEQKDNYKANQVAIQIKSGEAWICLGERRDSMALSLMNKAADMEDQTEKHPVTPGEVIPARELLGEMLLQLNEPAGALNAFEEVLRKHPNRFNAIYGAGLAAEKSGKGNLAKEYYNKLIQLADPGHEAREEILNSRKFLISYSKR